MLRRRHFKHPNPEKAEYQERLTPKKDSPRRELPLRVGDRERRDFSSLAAEVASLLGYGPRGRRGREKGMRAVEVVGVVMVSPVSLFLSSTPPDNERV